MPCANTTWRRRCASRRTTTAPRRVERIILMNQRHTTTLEPSSFAATHTFAARLYRARHPARP